MSTESSNRNPSPDAVDPAELASSVPLLALPEVVMFPGTGVQLELKDEALAEALASKRDTLVAVFTPRGSAHGDVAASDLQPVGALARVAAVRRIAGTHVLVLRGVARAEIEAITEHSPFPQARVRQALETNAALDDELSALFLSLQQNVAKVMTQLGVPQEFAAQVAAIETPGALADLIASRIEATTAEKAELLATLDVKARVRAVLTRVVRRGEVLAMRDTINAQVQSEIGKTQREHMLRQQKKAIERELGEEDGDEGGELDALEERVAQARLSDEARSVAEKQLRRLKSMQAGSPDFAATRTYVEWIVDLPWTEATPDATDLARVRAVLDADHYGLEKVKKRILEYLAVRKLKGDKKGPILCLIGPPGVGKTSLGRSIAGALGRKFHRASLGGVHDEAAIRGHRRTYVGALPGRIVQGLKKVGVTNPVFVLDEVDKLGQGLHGDPSSALLEVLDPEQNGTFADHYLEIPYDLSNVMFVATANVGDTIPAPLRDRMEIIEIPGYTRQEKLAIARRHLVPKQLLEHGLTTEQLEVTDQALQVIVDLYTREAGVRSLDKQVAAVVRGVAVRFAEAADAVVERVVVRTEDDVRAFLGAAKYRDEILERTSDPGVVTGLAWTPVGGTTLFVEATRMPGVGKLTLTGQLGDVMKESAMAALSYVRANTHRWGIARDFLDKSDIHIHVPAGAMPKDGPSAGVTMLTALVSLLTGIPARPDVAMTGEITLRGRVLPIGGLKEKSLAAHRAGVKRIIAPERNRQSLEDIPADVQRDVEFVFVSHMGEVIDAALVERPLPRTPTLVDAGAALSLAHH